MHAHAVPREDPGGEESCRAGADDHDAGTIDFGPTFGEHRVGWRGDFHRAAGPQRESEAGRKRLRVDRELDLTDEVQLAPAAARIERAAHEAEGAQVLGRQPHARGGALAQGFVRFSEALDEARDAENASSGGAGHLGRRRRSYRAGVP